MSATVVPIEYDLIVGASGVTSINGVAVTPTTFKALIANSNRAFLEIQNKSADVITYKFDNSFLLQANGVQTLTFGAVPTAGAFTLTYGGNETTELAYNASAATIQTAMQALVSVGAGNMTVAGAMPSFTFTGAGGKANMQLLPIGINENTLLNSALTDNSIQNINWSAPPAAGTFIATFKGQSTPPLAWNISTTDFAAALNNLSTINGGVDTVAQDPISLDFAVSMANAPLAGAPQPHISIASSLLTNQGVSTGAFTMSTGSKASTPISGVFAITVGQYVTVNLAYNAVAATIQAALEALPNIGVGNVLVAAVGADGHLEVGYNITYRAALVNTTVPKPSSAAWAKTLRFNALDLDDADDEPDFCKLGVATVTPAQGPVAVTVTVVDDNLGVSATAVSANFVIQVAGNAQPDDGLTIQTLKAELFDAECPTGALYLKSTGSASAVVVLAG